jgi:PAS domain S-box-containing protein
VIDWLLSTDGFVPRKMCGAWTQELVWLHVGSDILIWLAYLSIPLALVYFAGHRRLGKLNRIVWLFAAFILCCGFTHFIDALIFERPLYHLSGVVKALTAVVSWITVLALIPSVPHVVTALTRLGETSQEMPALGSRPFDPHPDAEGAKLAQYIVAALAATLAVLVRGLFDPIMTGDHSFVIPLLAVVFVSWHSGFWPGILTLLTSMVAVIFFFIEPKHSFVVGRFTDQLAVGFFLFAGVGCALLGQAQMNSRRKAARNLATAEAKQRELESLAADLAVAQRQTVETLAQLDMFVMNAPLGLAFFDRELRFVRINKHLAEANGLTIEEHLGRPITEAIKHLPPEGLDDYRRVLETGESLTDRLVIGPSDIPAAAGRVWESSYYPVRQADGNLLGVGVVTREISQKLRDEKAIKESEARFRSLAESMPQIVWVGRPDGYLEYINPNWYHYSGLTEEESLGWGWLDAVHEDDRVRSEKRWQHSTKTGADFEITYRLRGADGEYRWYLGRALPQRDESGKILRWFGTCTDIDDAKRLEDALKENEQQLEKRVEMRTQELSEAVAALRDEVDFRRKAEERVEASALELRRSNGELEQFAYVASHDLQEPLRKIQAFGDRLKVKCAPQLGGDGLDYLERMLTSSGRMRQLINDLLAYSRLSTKVRSFHTVNLATVMQGVLSDLEVRIQQTDARIDVGELPTIDADPLQMRQLFQNLLGNALKFAKEGQPPAIAVEAAETAGPKPMCELRFRDDGIGFDEKYLDRIFQVFQRLHGRGEYEGTGVGLAICHKIVLLHGGDITARSSPGNGATFIVSLPIHQTPKRNDPDE